MDFVNSEFTEHTGSGGRFDRLQTVEWRRWFLERWGLHAAADVSPGTLTRLKGLRSLLRELLVGDAAPSRGQLQRLNGLLAASPSIWRLRSDPASKPGARLAMGLQPVTAGWDSVLAGVVASFAELAVSGDIERVKCCGNPSCSFLFFDASAAQSRRWCDPAICGNLVKVREFRARGRRDSRR